MGPRRHSQPARPTSLVVAVTMCALWFAICLRPVERTSFKAHAVSAHSPRVGYLLHPSPLLPSPRVAIVNDSPMNSEVAMGVAYMLHRLGINAVMYMHRQRFGADHILSQFYDGTVLDASTFFSSPAHRHRMVVFPTWKHSQMEMLQALWQGGVTLALFVHLVEFVEHSDVLAFLQATSCFINSSGKNSVQGCTDARVVLFTVAPHVAAALTSVLAQHQLQIPVEWIVPVFPVPPLPPKQQAGTIMCIQGGIDPTRRNYVAIFEELAQLQQQQGQAGGSDVQLWLVGSLKPDIQLDIPKALTRSVKIHSNLAYREFFEVLQQCHTIIPSFATRAYLKNRASSTVSTALSASVPLVADADVMAAYSYLNSKAVLFTPNASNLASVLEALQRGTNFRDSIEELRQALCRHNAAAFLPYLVPR